MVAQIGSMTRDRLGSHGCDSEKSRRRGKYEQNTLKTNTNKKSVIQFKSEMFLVKVSTNG